MEGIREFDLSDFNAGLSEDFSRVSEALCLRSAEKAGRVQGRLEKFEGMHY